MITKLVILLSTVLIDLVDGEVRDKICPIHPVRICWLYGSKLMKVVPKSFIGGILLWLVTVLPLLFAYSVVPLTIFYIFRRHIIIEIFIVITIILLNKFTISLRLLLWYYREIVKLYREDRKGRARALLQEIVRRDVFSLDDSHVFSALIETFSESLIDSFASPIFWFSILGPVGSYIQRLANTMDSLVGYPYPPYRDIGKFSALVDTMLNLPASILFSIALISSNYRIGLFRRFLKNLKHSTHIKSLNARIVFSAIVSILNVKLEKVGEYVVGTGELPSVDMCEICYKVCIRGTILFTCIVVLLMCSLSILGLAVPCLAQLSMMVL